MENNSFILETRSIIWNAHAAGRDIRRCFTASYLFEPGFSSQEDAQEAVQTYGFPFEEFVLICLHDNEKTEHWYAVGLDDYNSGAVLSAAGLHYFDEAFADWESCGLEEIPNYLKNGSRTLNFGQKPWTDGIARDLLHCDPELKFLVPTSHKSSVRNIGNAFITLGIPFYSTLICIKTDEYTNRILSYYYSERSLDYMMPKIMRLRKKGVTHYNPFNGHTAKSDAEKNRLKKKQENGIRIQTALLPESELVRALRIENGLGVNSIERYRNDAGTDSETQQSVCFNCGKPVTVRIAPNGHKRYKCPHCGCSVMA